MTDSSELAHAALDEIAAVWQVDGTRIRWIDGGSQELPGFDWWPGDFQVQVRADQTRRNAVQPEVKLTIETAFLRDVDLKSRSFIDLAAASSRFSTSTYAWVYPPAQIRTQQHPKDEIPRLWLASSAYISSATLSWLARFLAQATIVQPINAQILAAHAPEMLGCGAPDTARPAHLADAGLDGMLEVVDQVLAPDGRLPSRWIGTGEFEEFAAEWGRSEYCFGSGDAEALTLEAPFGSDTALLRFLTSEVHPQLGRGLLCTLQLPWSAEASAAADQAAELNYLEATLWTGFPLLGCWHPKATPAGKHGLAFSIFVPNSLHVPGLVKALIAWSLDRLHWVRRTKFPSLIDLPLAQIFAQRSTGRPA